MTTAAAQTPTAPMDIGREQWQSLHRQVFDPNSEIMLSASNVGTICGRNPYKSAFTLFQQFRGRIPWDEETPEMRAGKAAEPEVAARYERETGRKTIDPGEFAIHVNPDHPWLFATLDRIDDTGRAVELKSPSLFNVSQWEEGNPPLQYQLQNQIQIACAGLDKGALCAVPRGRESVFYHFDFDRHDKAIERAIAVCIEFRERIANDDPPPIDYSPSTIETLKVLHPDDDGSTIERPDLASTVKLWIEAQQQSKDSANCADDLKNQIIAAFGSATYLVADGYRLSLKTTERAAHQVKGSKFRALRLCVK